MRYLRTYEELRYKGDKIEFYEPKAATNELLHIILDEILEAWEAYEKNHDSFKNHRYKRLNYKKIQNLIDAGANVNVHDESNNYGSLLCMAVDRKDLRLVKLLVENGANINDYNSTKATALYGATDIEIVKYLVENGADMNRPNDSGVLPLHHAVFDKNYEIATILLKSGSELTTKTGNRFKRGGYGLENWMKDKNYDFQKLLIEMHPDYVVENISQEKLHKRILKEYDYIFNANKYNL
jgi:hypothetical protein